MNGSNSADNADALTKTCSTTMTFLLDMGWWFLWLALIVAVLVTLLTIVERAIAAYAAYQAAKAKPVVANGESGGSAATAFVDSLKGMVESLSHAPAWFAIFLAAVLLYWAAPTFYGPKCALKPQAATGKGGTAAPDGNGAATDNAPAEGDGGERG